MPDEYVISEARPSVANRATESPESGVTAVTARPATDRPVVSADDLVDLMLHKGMLSEEEVAAIAAPNPGGPVHRINRLRHRYDAKSAKSSQELPPAG